MKNSGPVRRIAILLGKHAGVRASVTGMHASPQSCNNESMQACVRVSLACMQHLNRATTFCNFIINKQFIASLSSLPKIAFLWPTCKLLEGEFLPISSNHALTRARQR
jgi:hypothetical protein